MYLTVLRYIPLPYEETKNPCTESEMPGLDYHLSQLHLLTDLIMMRGNRHDTFSSDRRGLVTPSLN